MQRCAGSKAASNLDAAWERNDSEVLSFSPAEREQ
jgi:hypothetical protein